MYCPSCGKKVDDNMNFCPFCGVKLEHSEGSAVPADDAPDGQEISSLQETSAGASEIAPAEPEENSVSQESSDHAAETVQQESEENSSLQTFPENTLEGQDEQQSMPDASDDSVDNTAEEPEEQPSQRVSSEDGIQEDGSGAAENPLEKPDSEEESLEVPDEEEEPDILSEKTRVISPDELPEGSEVDAEDLEDEDYLDDTAEQAAEYRNPRPNTTGHHSTYVDPIENPDEQGGFHDTRSPFAIEDDEEFRRNRARHFEQRKKQRNQRVALVIILIIIGLLVVIFVMAVNGYLNFSNRHTDDNVTSVTVSSSAEEANASPAPTETVTPTPTATPTPTETPTPTPTATPEPTREAASEPTREAARESTREATPEPTRRTTPTPTATPRPTATPTPKASQSSGSGNHSESEISTWSKQRIQDRINELCGRNGRRFNNAELQAKYNGTIDPETFDANPAKYMSEADYKEYRLLVTYRKTAK